MFKSLRYFIKRDSGAISIEYALGFALFGLSLAVLTTDTGEAIRDYMFCISTGAGKSCTNNGNANNQGNNGVGNGNGGGVIGNRGNP